MSRVDVLTDVPAEEVQETMDDFSSEGATVQKARQPDGKFTVTATFPDSEDDADVALDE